MKTLPLLGAVVLVVIVIAGVVWWQTADTPTTPLATPDAEPEFVGETTNGDTLVTVTTPVASPLPTPADEAAPVAAGTTTIVIDESGFTPSKVTVAAGTTVQFVNHGQALHWPASDVHPTHEVLPAFDSKRGLATGETYSFTFEEPGTWAFHDHLQAQSTGTVTVQ